MSIKIALAPGSDSSDTPDTPTGDDSLDAAARAFAGLDDAGDTDDEDDVATAAAALSDDTPPPAAEPEADSADPDIEFTGEDGVVIRVPKSEIGKGYLRQADYTRKTQAAAEKTKEATALAERYAKGLQAIESVLAAELPQEPDWDALEQSVTPEEFAAEGIRYQNALRRYENTQRERATVEARLREAGEAARNARATEEAAKLMAAVPEWKDEKVRAKELGELTAYAATLGFSENDIAGVEDHRAFLMLRKSMKFDALMAQARSSAKNNGKTVTRPPNPAASRPTGTSVAPPQRDGFDKAKARLGRTGTVRDAAAALDALFGD